MIERTILHSDVNNFFASVECATCPELKDKPVAVAGDPEKRTGIILAKNEIAKKSGVQTGQTIFEAKRICPELVCLSPHYGLYEDISQRLHEVYLQYTDLVEPLGLDECWLDVTPSLKVLGKTGEEIAYEIKERIKKEFGFTVSVGVSFSKIYAKLGSDLKKPDAVTVIPKDRFKEIAYHLPLNSIVGIGRRLNSKFKLININTIGEFCALKESYIHDLLGITGVKLLQNLRGSEEDKVMCYYDQPAPKSVGNGTTTIKDIQKREDIEKVVAFLAEKISKRLIAGHFEGKTISISIKSNELKRYGKSASYAPCFASETITAHAMQILDSFYDYSLPIRAVRVNITNLDKIDKAKQISFFDEKPSKTAIGIKNITSKYGSDVIYKASDSEKFINRKNHREE